MPTSQIPVVFHKCEHPILLQELLKSSRECQVRAGHLLGVRDGKAGTLRWEMTQAASAFRGQKQVSINLGLALKLLLI